MKRDDDLIRKILFGLEESDDWLHILPATSLDASAEEHQERYLLDLMGDQGFVAGVGESSFRMTSQGHDFLDAIRDDNIWNKTKVGAVQVGGMTIGMMKDLAVAYLKQEAAEKLGIVL